MVKTGKTGADARKQLQFSPEIAAHCIVDMFATLNRGHRCWRVCFISPAVCGIVF